MTITKLRIDFEGFRSRQPNGAVYVAISSCTSLQGLRVSSLHPSMIHVSKKAISLFDYLQRLATVCFTRFWGIFSFETSPKHMESKWKIKNSAEYEESSDFQNVFSKNDRCRNVKNGIIQFPETSVLLDGLYASLFYIDSRPFLEVSHIWPFQAACIISYISSYLDFGLSI